VVGEKAIHIIGLTIAESTDSSIPIPTAPEASLANAMLEPVLAPSGTAELPMYPPACAFMETVVKAQIPDQTHPIQLVQKDSHTIYKLRFRIINLKQSFFIVGSRVEDHTSSASCPDDHPGQVLPSYRTSLFDVVVAAAVVVGWL